MHEFCFLIFTCTSKLFLGTCGIHYIFLFETRFSRLTKRVRIYFWQWLYSVGFSSCKICKKYGGVVGCKMIITVISCNSSLFFNWRAIAWVFNYRIWMPPIRRATRAPMACLSDFFSMFSPVFLKRIKQYHCIFTQKMFLKTF